MGGVITRAMIARGLTAEDWAIPARGQERAYNNHRIRQEQRLLPAGAGLLQALCEDF